MELQKDLAKKADVIMDGRDIGTCVLPDADVKVYLTASSAVRAKRRYNELKEKGTACDLDEIEKELGIATCPVNWPIGSGKRFKGVYDRKRKCVITYSDTEKGTKEGETLPLMHRSP